MRREAHRTGCFIGNRRLLKTRNRFEAGEGRLGKDASEDERNQGSGIPQEEGTEHERGEPRLVFPVEEDSRRLPVLLGLEDPFCDGVSDQFCDGMNIEFRHQPPAVGLDRSIGDSEPPGDLSRLESLGDRLQHILLTL